MRSKSSKWRRAVPLIGLLAMLSATAYPSIASAAGKARLTVVHAIPRLTVDVYANGGLLLDDFKPGTITRAISLDPGRYDIAITPAETKEKLLSASVQVKAKTDASAVAYLDNDGDATLGLFNNDMRPKERPRGRITVRHTAAAPEVDVRYKRPGGEWKDVSTDLANGEQASGGLKARTYRFDVVLAGTTKRVIGPVSLKIEPRTHYFMYAWGSADDQSLGLNLSTRRLPASR
jgi:hypothetical protein